MPLREEVLIMISALGSLALGVVSSIIGAYIYDKWLK